MTLGTTVRALRKARGWKQDELARRTGLNQTTISSIELDKRPNPTQDTFISLATAFEMPVTELMRRAGLAVETAESDIPEVAEVARIMMELSSEDRATVLKIARALQSQGVRS